MAGDRDELEGLDPALVPLWRTFPIDSYAAILRSGKAAATKKRYDKRDRARADAQAVIRMLTYYRDIHPELSTPDEFGYRVWESIEDGRFRWAILPTARKRRPVAAAQYRDRPLGRAR